jgi:hypothetical protein
MLVIEHTPFVAKRINKNLAGLLEGSVMPFEL